VDDVPVRLDFDRAERRVFVVPGSGPAERLDLFLAARLPEFSRAAVQRLIRDGHATVNGAAARPAARVRGGDRVEVTAPRILPPSVDPEDLPLRVLLDDPLFAVLDKTPDMAAHPGRGRLRGTIANAVAHRWGVAGAGGAHRPGIVHRLDLETSGVMVVAKTEAAHAALAAAFKARGVRKEYRALVHGDPAHDEDLIDAPLGRDLLDGKRMAVRYDGGGRDAVTEVVVAERFGAAAHVVCRPRTGRTHQIRVHLAHRGHPILGDRIYGRGRPGPVDVPRLMLHAARLVFPHPASGEPVAVEAPLPADFEAALEALRAIDGGARGR
jgi:23S rRNA pseudouridine1911/1915/1917 synthase